MSVDEHFLGMAPGYPIDSWDANLASSPYQNYPIPSFERGYAKDIPYLDLGPRMRIGPGDLPYTGPEEFCPDLGYGGRNDFGPSTSMVPRSRLLPSNGEPFCSRRTPFGPSACVERPIFDHFSPFRKSPTPNRYPIPEFHSHVPPNCSPAWDPYADRTMDPISGARTNIWAPHPPGSYERLRPPHLQQGSSRAGSGRGARSSSSYIGQTL